MSEVLHDYGILYGEDGTAYHVRAYGSELDDTLWQGWIEFEPVTGPGPSLRSPRETTQPNRIDTAYWASGLTPVYLEGALKRALNPTPDPPPRHAEFHSILNPFSVYQKGELLLRDQLHALAPTHLVNIIAAYRLSNIPLEELHAMPASELVALIVANVRASLASGEAHDRNSEMATET
jgi:hypothetical protein